HRFAIPLGLRHSEVPLLPLLNVSTLLMAHEHDGHAIEHCRAAHDRAVPVTESIAVELDELLANLLDVIQRVRTAIGSGDKDVLPGSRSAVHRVNVPLQSLFEFSEPAFASRLALRIGLLSNELSVFRDPLFEVDQRLLPLFVRLRHQFPSPAWRLQVNIFVNEMRVDLNSLRGTTRSIIP